MANIPDQEQDSAPDQEQEVSPDQEREVSPDQEQDTTPDQEQDAVAGGETTESADDSAASSPAEPRPAAEGRPWALPTWLRPRLTAAQVVITVLCLVAGFMVAAQLRQTQDESLTGMRQDDLVRLLDELNQRNEELAAEGQRLRQELAELRSSTSSQQAAQEAVEQQAQVYGVLAGVLPVRGPGVQLTIRDPQGTVPAQTLVTILEELRNAGAEAIELSEVRLAASSWIVDDDVAGVIVDGQELSPPYEWTALGAPETLSGALAIPGGALASVRNNGGEVELVESESLSIYAVRSLSEPEHAEPVEDDVQQD